MKPTVEFVRNIVEAYYKLPCNIVGGNLHIVVDDLNLEDSSILQCMEKALKKADVDTLFLGNLLLQFSEEDREEIFECEED